MTPTLPHITTLARSGALDRAWALFGEGGYHTATDDPAALAVKGRLLKDRAMLAAGAERAALLAQAITAYSGADAISAQPYLLINVATLTFLCGDQRRAAEIAAVVLERLDQPDISETPYWIAATRAEALLLRGDLSGADNALGDAIAHDPDGWSDHASTLRQLRLILEAGGLGTDWLDRHRPPRSLHFAGHLGVAETASDELRAQIDAILESERIGFGYGALAAGADIVIAESLIARGAELHITLPTTQIAFIAQSIAPYESGWRARFDACLSVAASVRFATSVDGDYEPLATSLAADLAMGAAVLNAKMLESEAVQLLIVDEGPGPYGAGASTARDGGAWAVAGRRQHVMLSPRSAAVVASGDRENQEGRADRRLAALLHISFYGLDDLDDAAFACAVDDFVAPFRVHCAAIAVQPVIVLPCGNARIVAFESVRDAWIYAHAASGTAEGSPVRIAGHYGLAYWLDDPPALMGPLLAMLTDISASSLPGTVTVSEAFASALVGQSNGNIRVELMGEVGAERLFALRAV